MRTKVIERGRGRERARDIKAQQREKRNKK